MRTWLAICLLALTTSAKAISAEAFVVMDLHGEVLMQKNSTEERSIASITKLFVAHEAVKLDPLEAITISQEDVREGRMRSTPLRAGQSYTRQQLIELALISSDNVAAIALARTAAPITSSATLVEGSGLDPRNRSTAFLIADATRMMHESEIAAISVKPRAEVGDRRSTNPLLTAEGWSFMLSKTGFIRQAGGCLTVVLHVKGEPLVITILGSSSTRQRWRDLAEIRRALGDTDFYVPVKVTKVKKKRR